MMITCESCDRQFEYADDDLLSVTCPHCGDQSQLDSDQMAINLEFNDEDYVTSTSAVVEVPKARARADLPIALDSGECAETTQILGTRQRGLRALQVSGVIGFVCLGLGWLRSEPAHPRGNSDCDFCSLV